MKQMVEVFEASGGPVIAVQRVPPEEISAYGVIDGAPERRHRRSTGIRDLVEKPKAEGRPERSRHHRPLHPDAGHLRGHRAHAARRRAARYSSPTACGLSRTSSAALRLPLRGGAPRRRQQARVPEGHGRVRPQARGSRRRLPRQYLKSLEPLRRAARAPRARRWPRPAATVAVHGTALAVTRERGPPWDLPGGRVGAGLLR